MTDTEKKQYPTCKPGKCDECGKTTTNLRVEYEGRILCVTCFVVADDD